MRESEPEVEGEHQRLGNEDALEAQLRLDLSLAVWFCTAAFSSQGRGLEEVDWLRKRLYTEKRKEARDRDPQVRMST